MRLIKLIAAASLLAIASCHSNSSERDGADISASDTIGKSAHNDSVAAAMQAIRDGGKMFGRGDEATSEFIFTTTTDSAH